MSNAIIMLKQSENEKRSRFMKVCKFCGALLSDTDLVCAKCGAGADASGISDSMSDSSTNDMMNDVPASAMMNDAYSASASNPQPAVPPFTSGFVPPSQPVLPSESSQSVYNQQPYGGVPQQPYAQQPYGGYSQPSGSYIPAGYGEPISERDVLKISDAIFYAASMIIPLAWLVLSIIWSTGCCGKSRKNLAIAGFILTGVAVVLVIVLSLFSFSN